MDGDDLLDTPLEQRAGKLEAIAPDLVIPRLLTSELDAGQRVLDEVFAWQPDAIIVGNPSATRLFQKATTKIPIVFANIGMDATWDIRANLLVGLGRTRAEKHDVTSVDLRHIGTNQLGIGLHAYGFDTRLADGCANFWIAMLAIIGLGLIPQRYWASASRRGSPAASLPVSPTDSPLNGQAADRAAKGAKKSARRR